MMLQETFIDPGNAKYGTCILCLNECDLGAYLHLECSLAYIDWKKTPEILDLWRKARKRRQIKEEHKKV